MKPPDAPEVLDRFHGELDLVEIIARQISRSIKSSVEFDDLISAGREGLLDAARRYDAERGIPFRAYANYRVRGAIMDGIRKMAALPRRAFERLSALEAATLVSEGAAEFALAEPAEALDDAEAEEVLDEHLAIVVTAAAVGLVSEAARTEPHEGVTEDDPETDYERAELLALVQKELGRLEPEEQEIIRRHYLEGVRLEDIANDLGVSKSWASRLHTRAMGRLTERMSPMVESFW